MLNPPIRRIYIGSQKRKDMSIDDKSEGKFLLVIRIISLVMFVVALLILNGCTQTPK